MKGYLWADVKRLFRGWNFYLSIVGVTLLFFYSLEQKGIRNDVLETYIASVTGSGIHIAAVFCAFAFSTAYCEDLEHLYSRYALIRGNIRHYVISKAIVIYGASIAVMLLGTLGFCVICSFRVPWAEVNDSAWNMVIQGNYSSLLENGMYFAYCMVYSLQLGLYMGLLSIVAAFLSTYISNIAFVLACPIALDQFLMELPSSPIDFVEYEPFLGLYDYDWQGFLKLFLLSVVPSICLACGIMWRIRKRIA